MQKSFQLIIQNTAFNSFLQFIPLIINLANSYYLSLVICIQLILQGWLALVQQFISYLRMKAKRPQVVQGVQVRMPQNYDFNTWGKDFSEYDKDYNLRTDAVWQKQQLKDWFRLTNRIFYFNKLQKKYQFIQPEDMYTLLYEPWGFEENEIMQWDGFSNTGATTSFQSGLGPKQKVQNTFNTFYSMPDYYIMCAMRFEKWFKCDQVYGEDRHVYYDRNPDHGLVNMQDHERYPCFREYYETRYSCADNIMSFLVELAYRKKAQGFFYEDYNSTQINSFPTVFDSPNTPENVTLTY